MEQLDLDQILFGLDTFITQCIDGSLQLEGALLESAEVLLDQLFVKLRDPSTRSNHLITLNLAKFVQAASYLISSSEVHGALAVRLLKVLANAVADEDHNRAVVVGDERFLKTLEAHIRDNFDYEDLNNLIFVLMKNLIVDSPGIAQQLAFMTDAIMTNVLYDKSYFGISVLAELIPYKKFTPETRKVLQFESLIISVISSRSKYDEDEFTEQLIDLSSILESLTSDLSLDFKDEYYEKQVQLNLFSIEEALYPLEFPNKLRVQRVVLSCSGNVSANPTTNNAVMLSYLLKGIHSDDETNGYKISMAFTIIGNYITSSSKKMEILDKDPQIISQALKKYNYLVDPVQFQGILHLLKGLVSFDTVSQLFQVDSVNEFASLVEATVRNSRYYTNFTDLLLKFLKKTLVLLGKSQVEALLKTNIIESLLSADSTYDYDIVFLLLLNKISIHGFPLAVYGPQLLDRVFKFPSANVPDIYIFEMTKTLGVLLQHNGQFMLDNYTDSILHFIEQCPSTKGEAAPQVAYMVENNVKYICHTLIELNKTYPVAQDLLNRAQLILPSQSHS